MTNRSLRGRRSRHAKNRDEADSAYRHGKGVKTTTKEEAASFRITANHLDEYFGR